MAANGISTLSTKQAKQEAKLAAAETKRTAGGNTAAVAYRTLHTLDINLLPTKYSGNNLIDNPNAGGLQLGRPWT